MGMARLSFSPLSVAWKGEASDFTPLLAAQLDSLGEAIGVDLTSLGQSEVSTAGGRRIDIVAQVDDGSEFIIENQYGRADHDHLTRGLAYAVARHARGLVVVAEEHRDEFRAVAQYLNELAELDTNRGIAVWLVEARAVRIEDSPWAPLFTAVVEPNQFTATVEKVRKSESAVTESDFFDHFSATDLRHAAETLVSRWVEAGYRRRLRPNHVVLEAPGPSAGGIRTVITAFNDGHILVPFSAYAGVNSGIPIDALTAPEFRTEADLLFGFTGKQSQTPPGWLTDERVDPVMNFCRKVAEFYRDALSAPAHESEIADSAAPTSLKLTQLNGRTSLTDRERPAP
jgi:hypothetical protein